MTGRELVAGSRLRPQPRLSTNGASSRRKTRLRGFCTAVKPVPIFRLIRADRGMALNRRTRTLA